MHAILNRPNRMLQIAAAIFLHAIFAGDAPADIFQWEYVNPADHTQGKQQSTTLAPDGAGVDAVPGANLTSRNLTMAFLMGADLRDAAFTGSTLTNAEFTGADIQGAAFGKSDFAFFSPPSGTGITLAQLTSTASFQSHDLSRINFNYNNLTGGNFASQNLAHASFRGATLTDADFSGAEIRGAWFQRVILWYLGGWHYYGGITLSQLYSTASYQARDLTGIGLSGDLSGGNFAGQNLTNSFFQGVLLTDADFTGAEIRGAAFLLAPSFNPFGGIDWSGEGLSLAQLYSTASYHSHDLSGITLRASYLAGANFAGHNLTDVHFSESTLTDANFHHANLTNSSFWSVTLTNADFTAADARGADDLDIPASAITTNLILSDGHIDGLDLDGGGLLEIRDYDGAQSNEFGDVVPPIPITIDQHLAIEAGGALRMVFEADAWDSTISFVPGIPVMLDGTLELSFADDVNLAGQVGRTFDLFDWTGVNPTGAFAVSSPYTWDLSNLYTTGEVTLISIPEPSSLFLLIFSLVAMVAADRANLRRSRVLHVAASMFFIAIVAAAAHADIFQWEYINPADPSQGKQQSTTLCPGGAGVDAFRGAGLAGRDLTKAYLVGANLSTFYFTGCYPCAQPKISNLSGANLTDADLTSANLSGAYLQDANLRGTNLTNAYFSHAELTDADLTGAEVRGASFFDYDEYVGSGITLAQLYSTASYQAKDLSGITLYGHYLASGNFARQQLTNANFSAATLTGADFTGAEVRGGNFYRDSVYNRGTGITLGQLYSTASYQAGNLNGINFSYNNLTRGNFAGQNLSNTNFGNATLTDAEFTGAWIRGADFYKYYGGTGISLAQLYSTASYQSHDLSGISLHDHDLIGGNFAGQNLTNSRFYLATLTAADFTSAEVRGVNFDYSGITLTQLYSTASYQTHNLTGISLGGIDLTGGNLARQNLTGSNFSLAKLAEANFKDADVRGASFSIPFYMVPHFAGLALPQLYSTASYQAGDLSGIGLAYLDLTGGNFAGLNLTNGNLGAANLAGANFRAANLTNVRFAASGGCMEFCSYIPATLSGADLTAADARGASFHYNDQFTGAITTNLILPDGQINGLDMNGGGLLVVRDYDGDPTRTNPYDGAPTPVPPIPITVDQHLTMAPGGMLRMVFEADAWDSTISFAAGIPVTLAGILELTFAEDVNFAGQVGRTFDLFDWTGVTPTGAFAVSSPYAWNLSNLYTTGEVTLAAIPEPACLALAAVGAFSLTFYRRRRIA